MLDEDWKIVEELASVLKRFKKATLFFSKDSASVAAVIPAMDKLTDDLDAKSEKTFHPSIIAALKLARKKLNRYYSLTDNSATYRVAMVLHPGMKLEYFKQHEWETDWIEEAEDLVRRIYDASYNIDTNKPATSEVTTPLTEDFLDFGNLSVPTAARTHEIDDYLRLAVENVTDPLQWWNNNRFLYPNLSRMARDYLCIPGKCFFSF